MKIKEIKEQFKICNNELKQLEFIMFNNGTFKEFCDTEQSAKIEINYLFELINKYYNEEQAKILKDIERNF